jgi:hypothetical protein
MEHQRPGFIAWSFFVVPDKKTFPAPRQATGKKATKQL